MVAASPEAKAEAMKDEDIVLEVLSHERGDGPGHAAFARILGRLADVTEAADKLCVAVETGGGTFPFELAFALRRTVDALR
jgi:hypothetical protein